MASESEQKIEQEQFHCGPLTYTKAGLMALFAWLLWGDLCYTLMEMVAPVIIPLQLRKLDAPNWVISMFIAAIPNIMTITAGPYIAVKSDRCRSRWGRRIPFIAASLPLITLNLIALAFSHDIAGTIQKLQMFARFAPATILIAVIGVAYLIFQFFNLLISTGFGALFNDVVPPSHLARFFGFYRMLGTALGTLYNFFIFQYSLSHFREIFLGAAILYFVGFTIMIFNVKEGPYPPLDENQRKPGKIAQFKIFFKESFHEPLYRLICYSGGVMAFASVAWSFATFYKLEMKMTMQEIGLFSGIGGIASFIAMYLAAIYVDRWHPMRVHSYTIIFTVIGPLMNWVWLFVDLPGSVFFWLSLAALILTTFLNSLAAACAQPMAMRLYPKSRYSQFGAAMGIMRSICRIAAGFVIGFFYDGIRWAFATYWHGGGIAAGPGYCYRFYFVWASGACVVNFVLVALAYRRWLQLGGDAGYHPPASWNKEGIEKNDIVPTTGFSSKYLRWALWMFDGTIHGSLLLAIVMVPVLWYFKLADGVRYFILYVIPLSVIISLVWWRQENGIREDIRLALAGKMPKFGILHHGMLLVFALKFLATLGLVIAQFAVSIHYHNGFYAMIFALSNITTNYLIVFCLFTFRRMERGYSTKLDAASLEIWKDFKKS